MEKVEKCAGRVVAVLRPTNLLLSSIEPIGIKSTWTIRGFAKKIKSHKQENQNKRQTFTYRMLMFFA